MPWTLKPARSFGAMISKFSLLTRTRILGLVPNGINATSTIDKNKNTTYTIAADGRLFGLDLDTGEINFGPFNLFRLCENVEFDPVG
jgi:hypothetical protein